MTILGMWTADLQDLNLNNLSIDTSTTTVAGGRTGTYCFRMLNDDYAHFTPTTPSDTIYYRVAIKNTSNWNPDLIYFMPIGGSTTIRNAVFTLPTNNLNVYDSTGLIDTVSINYSELNRWFLFEFYVYAHATAGEISVKFEDNIVYEATGLDTVYASEPLMNRVSYRVESNYRYLDDIMMRDDDWCGAGGLHVLVPNSGTTTENWTASAGDPEDCVDELPATFDDYISTAGKVSGTEHLFNISSLPEASGIIGGVCVCTKVKSTETSDIKIKSILKSGTTTSDPSGALINASEVFLAEYYDQNPDTAADWQSADIDTLEIGVKTE